LFAVAATVSKKSMFICNRFHVKQVNCTPFCGSHSQVFLYLEVVT